MTATVNANSVSPNEITLATDEGKATLRWWIKLGLEIQIESVYDQTRLTLTENNKERWLHFLDHPEEFDHEKSSKRRFRLAPR
jgi:hypothetical protein